MNAVLLGATKGMGRALARKMAERGDRLFLLGRDDTELARSASDLEARGAEGTVAFARCDLEDPTGFDAALAEAERALGGIDTIAVTAARFATQDELERNPALAEELLRVNFTNTVMFCVPHAGASSRREAAPSASSARSRASAAESPSFSTARAKPASAATSRGSTTSSARTASASSR